LSRPSSLAEDRLCQPASAITSLQCV